MTAKVIQLNRAPKACIWKLRHFKMTPEGFIHYECIVINEKGLTAFEAWQVNGFPGNPAFHEVTFDSLCDFPCPNISHEWLDTLDKELKIHNGKRSFITPHQTEYRQNITRENNHVNPKVPHPA